MRARRFVMMLVAMPTPDFKELLKDKDMFQAKTKAAAPRNKSRS